MLERRGTTPTLHGQTGGDRIRVSWPSLDTTELLLLFLVGLTDNFLTSSVCSALLQSSEGERRTEAARQVGRVCMRVCGGGGRGGDILHRRVYRGPRRAVQLRDTAALTTNMYCHRSSGYRGAKGALIIGWGAPA